MMKKLLLFALIILVGRYNLLYLPPERRAKIW